MFITWVIDKANVIGLWTRNHHNVADLVMALILALIFCRLTCTPYEEENLSICLLALPLVFASHP